MNNRHRAGSFQSQSSSGSVANISRKAASFSVAQQETSQRIEKYFLMSLQWWHLSFSIVSVY
jgi:hypothetical protein